MSPIIANARRVSWRRLLGSGLLAAALAGLAGGALERWWFGGDDAAAAKRVEALVRRDFAQMTAALEQVAEGIASDPAAATALAAGSEGARPLFDLLAGIRSRSAHPENIAVTVYDDRGIAIAWSGRPSADIPMERTSGVQDLFVQRSALGLRLVHIHPIAGPDARRVGSIAAEHVLSRAAAGAAIAQTDESLSTSIAPVSFRPRSEGAGEQQRLGAFVLRTADNETLVEASVRTADLQRARAAWRRTVVAWVAVIVGVTLLLLIGPLLDGRIATPRRGTFTYNTILASLLLAAGAATIWFGLFWSTNGQPGLPVNLSFCGIGLAALAALWVAPATRLPLALRTRRKALPGAMPTFVMMHLVAGLAVAVCMFSFTLALAAAVDPTKIDVRHFSLYPWDGTRALWLVGVVALQGAVLWTATLTLTAARGVWRLPYRSSLTRAWLLALWLAPTVAAVVATAATGRAIPAVGLLISATACAIAALLARRLVTWYRHATVAARIFVLFLAFLIPAVLLYPSLDFFAEKAIQRLISSDYAVEAQNHPNEIKDRLTQARAEIDAIPSLPDLVSDGGREPGARLDADRAFNVWRQTVLARNRLTSAVELYDRTGAPISRFALNLPEYTGSGQQPQAISSCNWEVFAEPLPIGSDERLVLHAERGICADDPDTGMRTAAGVIIVHVAFDYRTLPFITSQSPYFEVFRPNQPGAVSAMAPGSDVRVAIYGWGLKPLYTSGVSAWSINDALFQRIYDAARTPFWDTMPLGDETYRVYFTNDRSRIYAIGYPLPTLFDHFVHLAELSTLAGAAFVFVLFGTAVFTRLSRERPRVGRALLREIRASFYRKLFLAFVAASIVPVLVLALVIRAYFADLLRNDIQAEAARTAAVAQRVIEESDALLRRGAEGVDPVDDDVMVWIRQVIDQDVNIFDGPRLAATSERDLFQSGLLPERTPDDVYRAITLQRLPSFVDEDQLGTVPYLIAAAPLRVNDRDFILSVPLAARQQEIERQKYELDRGVHLAALCFILFGAALGLSLAERIADPVRRLTRATQRIGRGDFDARIAVKSVDELRRLVDAFNSMAEQLKTQRAELERTHRLAAWAEMARQVAHEIKNPLTPIQLSAEHLRRVNADRGKPLGDVLEGCVSTILGQVRLLRQIAAEFSSFASSPTARIAPVDVAALVAEIVDPYRAGLAGRIDIHNDVAPPLPQALVDRTLILRALANIVENALHAMPGHGMLQLTASVDADNVVITVRDTGVGMDEEALGRVFEPYFSTKASGTGLGLPIARRNVEVSGGTIEVESRKGQGTTVHVRLPRADAAALADV
ncbi:MAG TPA: HAMP domain-containing sensor histidine kinase [Vicinamibacterales bacterium]|nr:HAMP domain-containing sensor histidine kinase [Vicinamibacterales bacterium]